ncbi:MAG: TIGR01620 family protein [Beijerinckiaceae bacterium]|nr:TIGR01620 family protein [Beijerinckiaceae bacterium]
MSERIPERVATARPRAFRLDDADLGPTAPERDRIIVESQPDVFAKDPDGDPRDDEQIVEAAQKKGIVARSLFSWGGLFWSAATGIVTLALGLWFDRLLSDLFARTPALGWVGAALVGALVLALLVLAGREVAGVLRQKRIGKMHIALAQARAADDTEAARGLVRDLGALYVNRPETAKARAHVLDLTREIVDGRDLIDIAERTLVTPLDQTVQHEIARAAKRVSVVTAISPRAIVDVLFVAAQAFRLVRRISEIYGGRPGMVGFLRLLRSVGAHLAITGGMAAGDSLVQQVLGHGIAAKLSARLGEGVLNGLLTARVGLSAMAVCRPMPFAAEPQPGVKDVAPFLFRSEA